MSHAQRSALDVIVESPDVVVREHRSGDTPEDREAVVFFDQPFALPNRLQPESGTIGDQLQRRVRADPERGALGITTRPRRSTLTRMARTSADVSRNRGYSSGLLVDGEIGQSECLTT